MSQRTAFLQSIYAYSQKYIDYKMGALTAAFMGMVVGIINADFGWLLALTAGLKQAAYTFLFGGVIIKMCKTIAVQVKGGVKARILGALIPSVVTIGAIFLVHNLRGTPKPFESTIPTMILAPSGFTVMAWRERSQWEKKQSLNK